MNEKTQNQEAVRDARQLGIPKMLILGIQHIGKMPIHPEFAELVDEGRFAEVDNTDIAKINI